MLKVHQIHTFFVIDSLSSVFQASKRYLSVARLMKEYEDKKYEVWREQVESNLMIYLKKNLLSKPTASSATTHRSAADENTVSEDAQELLNNQSTQPFARHNLSFSLSTPFVSSLFHSFLVSLHNSLFLPIAVSFFSRYLSIRSGADENISKGAAGLPICHDT